MIFKLGYSPASVRDLDRVWEEAYTASGNVEASSQYVNELMDEIRKKRESPKSGIPLYYQNTSTGYCCVVFKAYIVFYRVDDESVKIDRILPGSSDYMRVLFSL